MHLVRIDLATQSCKTPGTPIVIVTARMNDPQAWLEDFLTWNWRMPNGQ